MIARLCTRGSSCFSFVLLSFLSSSSSLLLSFVSPAGEEGWSWLEKLQPEKFEYADLRSLTLLYGGQAFGLSRFAEPPSDRLGQATKELNCVYEVYTVHQVGLAQRILGAFASAQRDDFGHTMALTPDTRSRPSLMRLYTSLNMQAASVSEKLFTHITIRLKGKMVPRVLVWVQQGFGRTASPSDAQLVILECASSALACAPSPPSSEEVPDPSSDIFRNGVRFRLDDLHSVDFPEENSGMTLGFPEANLHIVFYDDAARQMWRVALKAQFLKSMDASGNWRQALLPSNQNARLVYATKLL